MSKQKQKRPAFSGFSKLAVIIGGLFAVCAAGMGYYVYRQKTAAPAIETVKAERRDLKEQVSVTGTVEPVERADLSFDLSGRVDLVLVEIGQTVKAGDGLIKLESADLAAEYAQAQAKVKAEEARLAQLQAAVMVQESLYKELQRGATNEEIELARLKVANAEKELADALIQQQNVLIETNTEVENAYQTSKTLLSEASTVFDRILFARTQSMFTTGIGEKNLVFTTSDHQIETAARTQRAQSELRLAQLKSSLSTALSHEQIDELSQKTLEDSLYIRDFLFTLNAALKGELDLSDTLKATFSSDVDQSLADIALIQNKLNSQSQTLSSAKLASNNKTDAVQATVNTAQNVVLLAKQELSKLLAGSTIEELASQAARIEEAKANLLSQQAVIESARAQTEVISARLAKTVLRSPIDGIVTRQEAEVGETAQAQQILVSISSERQFQITAYVPEVDIAGVAVGQSASLTLDAYGPNTLFAAQLVKIDPAETVIEGVSTYKITLQFTQEDTRIKSGMTANIDILTDSAQNAVAIPLRTVIRENGSAHVRLLVNGEVVTRTVTVGLISWDGFAQIVSGLEAGEDVVTFIGS